MVQCLHVQDYVGAISNDAINAIIGHFVFTFQLDACHLLGHRLHNAAEILGLLRAFGEQQDFAELFLLRMYVGEVAAPARSGTMKFDMARH